MNWGRLVPCLLFNSMTQYIYFSIWFTFHALLKNEGKLYKCIHAKQMTTSVWALLATSVQTHILRKESILLNITWRQQNRKQQKRKMVTEKFSAEEHTLYFSLFAMFTEKSMADLLYCDCDVTNCYCRLTSYYTSSFV